MTDQTDACLLKQWDEKKQWYTNNGTKDNGTNKHIHCNARRASDGSVLVVVVVLVVVCVVMVVVVVVVMVEVAMVVEVIPVVMAAVSSSAS